MFNEADGGMSQSVFRQAKQIVEIMAGIQGGPVDPLSLRTRRGRVVFVVERRSHRAPLSSPRRYRVINVITSAGNATLIRRIIVRIPP